MTKYVELNKRTKKERKAYYSSLRNTNGFNTGTRTMQTEKNPTRAKSKRDFRRMLDKGEY